MTASAPDGDVAPADRIPGGPRSRLVATARRPFWLLSPTWALAQILKPRERVARARLIRRLNVLYFSGAALAVAGTIALSGDDPAAIAPRGLRWWAVLLQYVVLWRFFEVLRAFLHDAFDKLHGVPSTSALEWGERVALAFRSYVELILDFSLVYALMPASAWVGSGASEAPKRVSDLVWYSANVITTSGGGGYVPASLPLRLLTIAEILCGVLLLVVSFTIYTGRALERAPPAE